MPLQHIQLHAIAIDDVRALVENRETEDRFIEYKAELYGNNDDGYRELCYDVTAFANAVGGDIICGVAETKKEGRNTGAPEAASGVPDFNDDEVIRRYHQVLGARVQPRVPGVEMRSISGCPRGPILVIRVPQSWAMPHLVKNNDWFRCYIRRGNSKGDPIDVHQLRDAFLLSSTLRERLRAFRSERVEKIRNGKTPVQLGTEPKVIIHVVSFASLSGGARLNWANDVLHSMKPPTLGDHVCMTGYQQAHGRFNLEGYLLYNAELNTQTQQWGQCSYLQLYSDGALEIVDSLDQGEKYLPPRFGARIAGYLADALSKAKKMDFAPPAFVMISLLGMNGRHLFVDERPPARTPPILGGHQPFDRADLILPEVLIDDFEMDMKVGLRDALDALWQAGGWSAYFER